MTTAQSPGALRLAVASYDLPGATFPPPDRPLDAHDWQRLRAAIRQERLSGLLAAAVASGAWPVTAGQRNEVAELHRDAMAVAVVLDALLVQLSRVLDAANVDHRVLKGSGVAHTSYPDPAWRQYGDIDLLVPAVRYDDAIHALGQAGCQRTRPQLRTGFDRRYGKGTTLRHEDGHWVDVHRTLAMGPFGLAVQTADLFATATPFTVAGHTVRALGPELRFLQACYNAALGDVSPRLVALRDVAQLLLDHQLDRDRVLELAMAWEGQAVVARAVQLTWERFGIADRVPLSEWAHRYQPSRAEQRALSRHLESGNRYARKALASLRQIDGLRAKAGYLHAVALPSREFLQQRDLGTWGWLRRGRESLRGSRRRD